MWYKEFRCENFKGIRQLSLPLTGPATMMIGLNESGKTTILESIYCFDYGSENLGALNPGLMSLKEPETWIPISARANFNGKIKLTAVVGLDDEDRRSLRSTMLKDFNLKLGRVQSDIDITETYHFENSKYIKTTAMWSLRIAGTKVGGRKERTYEGKSPEWQGAVKFLKAKLPRIWYFPDFLFELPDQFSLDPGSGASVEERDRNKFYRDIFDQIAQSLGDGASLQTLVVDRLASDERADRRALDAALLAMSEQVSSRIYENWSKIFGSAETDQEVRINAWSEDGIPYIDLKIRGRDGYYDVSERSLGFRWFFTFLLFTAFRPLASTTQRSLILLDEPASNLHSSAQLQLLRSFSEISATAHLAYTTHSNHMIDVRWLNDAYVVRNEAVSLDPAEYFNSRIGSRTQIVAEKYRRFANQHPDKSSYFQPVLDLLDFKASDIEHAPQAVLLEGKTDFYLLRYAKLLRPSILENVRLVPGTGAGTLEESIRLYIGLAKPFLVVLDGDTEGRVQQGRYLEMFGPILSQHSHLLPTLVGDESVKEIEDLLTEGDKGTIIHAVDPSLPVSKKSLHKAIAELLAAGVEVSLDPTTWERIEGLSEALSEKLTSSV